jgi:hypothetical protein
MPKDTRNDIDPAIKARAEAYITAHAGTFTAHMLHQHLTSYTAATRARVPDLLARIEAGQPLFDLPETDREEEAARLTAIIVPLDGCEGNSSDTVAAALVQLCQLFINDAEDKKGAGAEYITSFVLQAAFNRTHAHYDHIKAWQDSVLAAVVTDDPPSMM